MGEAFHQSPRSHLHSHLHHRTRKLHHPRRSMLRSHRTNTRHRSQRIHFHRTEQSPHLHSNRNHHHPSQMEAQLIHLNPPNLQARADDQALSFCDQIL